MGGFAVLVALFSQAQIERCTAAMASNDFRAAVACFEGALKVNPKDPAVLNPLALSLAGLERFEEAAERFGELVALQPTIPEHRYNLGLALLQTGQAQAAERELREALKLAPSNTRALLQLANSLLEQARSGNSAKLPEATGIYRQAAVLLPGNPDLHFNLAYALARGGDNEAAAREYREVLKLQPRFPRARFSLGVTLFSLGEWDEAATLLRAALAEGQRDFFIYYYLGSTLLRKGDYRPALTYLQIAARKDTEHAGVHFQLASVFRGLGDRARASAEQRLFVELRARADAKLRAESLEQAARDALKMGDLGSGISSLTALYKARPDAASARNLGLAHLQSRNRAEARSYLLRALELDARDAATYNYLGLLEADEGNLEQAVRRFRKASELDPKWVDPRYNSAVAQSKLGRYAGAIADFRTALKISDTSNIREALASVLAEAGQQAEAERQFDSAQRDQRRTTVK